jgi:hypothetical protein
MPVIARDAVASDHLVYAWPFPIGPEEYEVSCSDDEQVVMCPAWVVGDRLGPGRHRWRTPDPTRPVSAYFVLLAPVEIPFDVVTSFALPNTGQPVRLRANGSLQVRCSDPGLLVAQFVGLPFDNVNDGIVRSATRSIERMLARLLTRRVVMAGTPQAATDPSQLTSIIEELVAYNPAAGAVFGIELSRMGHVSILADDGSGAVHAMRAPSNDIPLLETVRAPRGNPIQQVSGEIPVRALGSSDSRSVSGEIGMKRERAGSEPSGPRASSPVPQPRKADSIEIPQTDEITQPSVKTPLPGSVTVRATTHSEPEESRGSIMGIGMSPIGSSASGTVSGEIQKKATPGQRVLVAGPDGLMQSATVRQLLQGYYELEVGGSGETIWVPVTGVVPES